MINFEERRIKIYPRAVVLGMENIDFGENIIIDDFSFIYAKNKISLGSFVHLCIFSSITGGDFVEIGDFVAISQGARVLTSTDDFKAHGFGNSTLSDDFRNVLTAPVKIGRFCIVGANSVILPGVHIGEGASVGANSVVTKDIPAWSIFAGRRVVGQRDKAGVIKNHNEFLKRSSFDRLGNVLRSL